MLAAAAATLMADFSAHITFVVFTFNEERRIERVIKNFIQFGRVLVVDNESSDGTRDIAQQYSCDILINKNMGWVEDELTASKVKQAVKTEWIYWGFADEMVDQATMNAILSSVQSGLFDIINIAKNNYYYGRLCRGVLPDRLNRIFRKDAIDFAGNRIHGFGTVRSGMRVHTLSSKFFVHHFISNTAKSYLQVMDRYTDTEVVDDRPTPSPLRMLTFTVKAVLLNLVLRRGYRGGMPSFFLVSNNVYYRWLSAMKQYEKKLQLDRDAIEGRNDEVRDHILNTLHQRT